MNRSPIRRKPAPGNPFSTFGPRTAGLPHPRPAPVLSPGFAAKNLPIERDPGRMREPQAERRVRTAPARKGRRTGAASGQPKAPGEFTDAVKLAVRKRAAGGLDLASAECEGCGVELGEKGGEYQHRAARGSGGCRDAVVNGPAGCLLLCRGCHASAEARRDDLSEEGAGLWIRHGTTPEYDPRNVSIDLHGLGAGRLGGVFWLAEDGVGPNGDGYLFASPNVGRAAA